MQAEWIHRQPNATRIVAGYTGNVGVNPIRHIVKGGRAAVQNGFRIVG